MGKGIAYDQPHLVTRPGYEISLTHVTAEIRERIIDRRGAGPPQAELEQNLKIYITDAVNLDISATNIRRRIRVSSSDWRADLAKEVAKYIEKYQIYS